MIEVLRLPGLTSYADAQALQKARVQALQRNEAANALFLLEHAPVITLGRNAHLENLLRSPDALSALGVQLETTDRGGDVTYHGPGQLVAYPILDLHQWRLSVGWYLRRLEEVLVDLLAGYGLKGERSAGQTGVWCEGAKVAAIGVGVHRWVTFHGIALNVNPDMSHFGLIIPCGIQDKPVTSLQALLGQAPPMEEVMERFKTSFRRSFGE